MGLRHDELSSLTTQDRATTYPEDCSGLEHLRHKRRYALELTVAGTNTSEDAVEDRELSLGRGNKASNLGHEGDDSNL